MSDCRILALGGDWPQRGPGWQLLAVDGDPLVVAADVALLPADSPLDAALLDRLALPLIVAVAEGAAPSPWLDRADGYLLPGDDVAVIGHVVRAVTGGSVAGVADTGTTSQQIHALSEQARRLADSLAALAEVAEADAPMAIDATLVRRLIRLRRDRDRHFPAELFADPAWDMLLDLAAARLEGSDVTVSSLCLAAAVPTTTALRWVRSLSDAGLFERRTDPADARRAFIALSDPAFDAVAGWLRRFARIFQAR